MQDEYLSKCVVDTSRRTFYLYSDDGDTREVECETMEQFMGVLKFVRDTLGDELVYAEPLVDSRGKINF
ncbi:MAG: hypothetical protein CBD69_011060 [Crocinitomicaceae bacterium TMED209]|nr:MAG: hypothetical protein CBD69_011060 [Crocinitomicaceae bacterium TMED209]